MKSKLLEPYGPKNFALVFDTGEEAMSGLLSFAKEHSLVGAHFTGIGAFSQVVLGYYDWEKKEYLKIPVDEQVEVVSLVGDVALEKDQPKIHAHVVVGKRNGSTAGGHLLKAYVRPTLEIVLTESPAHLRREFDPASGLALIRL
ncbi:MAG TPA: PPC domain-containing DNA-binding protein [Bryobacteraceae bacterium]|nr:PPC domain-containing DNA-binding protein [Bryobacteraceae bacterium]